MKCIIIATTKTWNIDMAMMLKKRTTDYNIHIISNKSELTFELLENTKPEYVFFPHWSWIIPKKIHSQFKCVVFHMTDLPYGRGGSPLQNLISRGITETKITALAVDSGIDTGMIYLKRPMSLYGGAEEIYIRCARIIFDEMIPHILEYNPIPLQQEGAITIFQRRTPEMSELTGNMTLDEIYDQIRMLDADEYPQAFIKLGKYSIRFSRPKKAFNSIIADAIISEESEHSVQKQKDTSDSSTSR